MTAKLACAILYAFMVTALASDAAVAPSWVGDRTVILTTQNWGQSGAAKPKGEWVASVVFNDSIATLRYRSKQPLKEGTFGYQGVSCSGGNIQYSFPVGNVPSYPFRSAAFAAVNLTSGRARVVPVPGLANLGDIRGARYDPLRRVLVVWGVTDPKPGLESSTPRNFIADLDPSTQRLTLWPGNSGNFSLAVCAALPGLVDYDPATQTAFAGCGVLNEPDYMAGVQRGHGLVLRSGPVGSTFDLTRAVCASVRGSPPFAIVRKFLPTVPDPISGPDIFKVFSGNGSSLQPVFIIDNRTLVSGTLCDRANPGAAVYLTVSKTNKTDFELHWTSIHSNPPQDAPPVKTDLERMQPRDIELLSSSGPP